MSCNLEKQNPKGLLTDIACESVTNGSNLIFPKTILDGTLERPIGSMKNSKWVFGAGWPRG